MQVPPRNARSETSSLTDLPPTDRAELHRPAGSRPPQGFHVVASKRAPKWLSWAVVVGIAIFALWWTGGWQPLWELFSDRERLRAVVEDSGPLAPMVYMLLLVVQAILLPLPAPPVAIAGGYVFGTLFGFILTWLGVLLGGAVSFWIARTFGRGFVVRSKHLTGLDRPVEDHGAIIIFGLRLIPLISFDAISYAAGLSNISFPKFLLATALGMIPGTFVFVYLGGASPGPGPYLALGVLALLAAVAYTYHRKLGKRWIGK